MPARRSPTLIVTLLTIVTLTVAANAAAQGGDSQGDQLMRTAQALFAPLPDLAENAANPVTDAKVELGKMLYYEPRLSLSGVFSCNSCHNIATYGVDNLETATGHGWAQGPRNSPTVMNAALQASQFWDGRAKDVEEQAGGPILNPIEMGIPSQEFAIERLSSIPQYAELFAMAFPDEAEPLVYANVANAIGAFERTLVTPARFDTYLGGDQSALSDLEKTGLQTFISYGCAGCHSGATVGGNSLQRFGVVESYWEATREFVTIDTPTMGMDVGRFAVTHETQDLYIFKVPTLRNITRTYPYFHDGSVWDLRDATQIMARVQLGRELTEEDLDALMAFYDTLEGEIPAYALQLPVLPASTTGTPKPQH